MKYCIVVPDGAADFPVAKLDGRTPLEAARTPNMDRAAREGLLGTTCHVPPRMRPGSAVAMMSVVGYDPIEHFPGRGPLEAADLGVEMGPRDWAIHCNLVTAGDDALVDFTAGHITCEEAAVLIETLNKELGSDVLTFHAGTSYRHILIYSGPLSLAVETVPPHDIVGQSLRENYPQGENCELLVDLMERSRPVLEAHEISEVRRDLGQDPANMIWLWGQGRRPDLEDFQDRFGLSGCVISAVNLVRGIGRLVGWEVITVPGATAYVDTDYAAKGRYAVDALTRCDLVL
ncbi:MAG: 2,3-bisphosphoglycerate-independent phosphoglycerate mutase, partial [Candidatus Brocadiae bacterium]|nr:2,3-bisphosphoglycerate-independent phosphoglycerate mutase [Candidatus Brocadiia bacterium]